MRDAVDAIRRRGAELVVVGNGTPAQANDFREERQITFPLLVDPEMHAYRAAGLRRGIRDTMNLRTMKNAVQSFRKGFRQGAVQGDPWQLGGAFVISQRGKVLYRHVSREAGDHPEPDDLLAVLG